MKTYFGDRLKNKLIVNYSESSGSVQIPVNRGRFILWLKLALMMVITIAIIMWKVNSKLVNNNKMLESRIDLTQKILSNFGDQVSTLISINERIGSLDIDSETDGQLNRTQTKTDSENEDTKTTQKTGGK